MFSNSEIFHLVRDPRKVIPSIFTRRDDKRIHKIPKKENDIYFFCNKDNDTTFSVVVGVTVSIRQITAVDWQFRLIFYCCN